MKHNKLYLIVSISLLFPVFIFSQWAPCNNGLDGGCNYFTSINNYFFDGNYYGVYKSTDLGQSWESKDSGLTSTVVRGLYVNGNEIIVSTSYFNDSLNSFIGELSISTDLGEFWVKKKNPTTTLYINSLAFNGNNIYACSDSGVYVSNDNCNNWSKRDSGKSDKGANCIAFFQNEIIVGTYYGVYFSTDEGNSWIEKNNGFTSQWIMSLLIIGNDIYAGTWGGGVYKSTDNGNSWAKKNVGLLNLDITVLIKKNNYIYAGTWGGFYLSTDYGNSWIQKNQGLKVYTISSMFIFNDYMYIEAYTDAIYKANLDDLNSDEFSNHSGWDNKGTYKEQKLKINIMTSIHFNEDGTKYYTLNSNIIYYWDIQSGKLQDSFYLSDHNAIANFSMDSKTVCYYLPITPYTGPTFPVDISIYDLTTKLKIAKSTIKIPDDINYNKPIQNLGYIDDQKQLTMLDYDFLNKELTCGVSFNYYYNLNHGNILNEYRTLCGGSSIFDVKIYKLFKKRQTSSVTTLALVNTNNSDYMTFCERKRVSGDSLSFKNDYTDYSFQFVKIDDNINKSINLKSGSYQYHISYDGGYFHKTDSTGLYKPFTKLLIDDTNHILYLKTDSLYYYVDIKFDSIYDSLKLPNNFGFEKLTNNNKEIIYYDENKIFVQNIRNKKILSEFECPFIPKYLEINPNGKDFIIANDSGKVLYYNDVLLNVIELTSSNKSNIQISPNPASDFIEISGLAGLEPAPAIQIYNVMGELVVQTPTSVQSDFGRGGVTPPLRIDVSSLLPGLYFVRVADKVRKLIVLR